MSSGCMSVFLNTTQKKIDLVRVKYSLIQITTNEKLPLSVKLFCIILNSIFDFSIKFSLK